MLAGSHRNAWPDETGTGGRTNRNTHFSPVIAADLTLAVIFAKLAHQIY